MFTHLNCVIKCLLNTFTSNQMQSTSLLARFSSANKILINNKKLGFISNLFPAAHTFPEVTPLPSIKSLVSCYVRYLWCRSFFSLLTFRWKGRCMLRASVVFVSVRSIPTSGNSTYMVLWGTTCLSFSVHQVEGGWAAPIPVQISQDWPISTVHPPGQRVQGWANAPPQYKVSQSRDSCRKDWKRKDPFPR